MTQSPVESVDPEAAAVAILADRLTDSYGLRVRDLKFLGGELDRNYRVSTIDGATYLAKLRIRADQPGPLEWQEAILVHLSDRDLDVAVPSLVRTVEGDLHLRIDAGSEQWLLKVLNWVSGIELVNVVDHSEALLTGLGTTAAHVTHALEGFTSSSLLETHHWDVCRSGEVIDACLAQAPDLGDSVDVQTARQWFAAIEPLLPVLPKAMVHNDLNDNNVLVEVQGDIQRVSGVLDFNDALYSVRVAELAIAGAYAMLRKSDPLAALGNVVAGYHRVTPLTDDELEVIYPLAVARLCVQALTWATRGRTDPTAYGTMRMRYTRPALSRALHIDPRVASAYLRTECGRGQEHSSTVLSALIEASPPAAILNPGLAPHFTDLGPAAHAVPETLESHPVLGSGHMSAHAHRSDIWRPEVGEPETISIGTAFWSRFAVDVHAPFAGRVTTTQPLTIEHRHPDGPTAVYSVWHGVKAVVDEGDSVKPGQVIAEGAPSESGADPGWRVQLTTDGQLAARLPAYCRPIDARYWAAVTIDPAILFEGGERHLARSQRSSLRSPMTLVTGRGVWLEDVNGIRYLDASNNGTHIGHCEPRIVEAAHRQMRLLDTNNRSVHPQLADYAERLTATLPEPLDTVFFVGTGGDANDLAIRMARQVTGRRDVLAIDGAYRGNTTAVTEVALPDCYRGPFGYDDPESGLKYAADVKAAVARLAAAGTPPAAFIAESLVGAAGNYVLPQGYLAASFAHVRAAGGLCISDEVQLGVGRMGTRFWGFETHGVVPDIVTMGEPMGNGYPVAAVVTTREIAAAFDAGTKSFNMFAGNPVSGAVGSAVLDIVEGDGLQQRAHDVGGYFAESLRTLQSDYPLIGDVRGQGLYLGVDLVTNPVSKTPATEYALQVSERLKERSIVLYPNGTHGNVLNIKPPIIFSRRNVDLFVQRLADVLAMTDIMPRETGSES